MLSRDDIIEAASKAGFETLRDMIWVDQCEVTHTLTRFAALVAAAEREACARVCETLWNAAECVDAIRARGQQQEPEDENPSFG